MHRHAAMPYPWLSQCTRPWKRPTRVCSVYIGEQGPKLMQAKAAYVMLVITYQS